MWGHQVERFSGQSTKVHDTHMMTSSSYVFSSNRACDITHRLMDEQTSIKVLIDRWCKDYNYACSMPIRPPCVAWEGHQEMELNKRKCSVHNYYHSEMESLYYKTSTRLRVQWSTRAERYMYVWAQGLNCIVTKQNEVSHARIGFSPACLPACHGGLCPAEHGNLLLVACMLCVSTRCLVLVC